MTEIEEKSLKAQIDLYEGIRDADRMIIHTAQSVAKEVFSEIVQSKVYRKEGQKTVELTLDEFTKLRIALEKLSSDSGYAQLNTWIDSTYISPKQEKVKILNLLK